MCEDEVFPEKFLEREELPQYVVGRHHDGGREGCLGMKETGKWS